MEKKKKKNKEKGKRKIQEKKEIATRIRKNKQKEEKCLGTRWRRHISQYGQYPNITEEDKKACYGGR